MEGERGTVCVTGGTGYLASCLIMKLLEQGYSVNTTVRPHPGKFSIYISLTYEKRSVNNGKYHENSFTRRRSNSGSNCITLFK
jgi:nucleoside-diphosphate-sugar epimerase